MVRGIEAHGKWQGWIAPDGTCFECANGQHVVKARELLKKFYGIEAKSLPDDSLVYRGWILIHDFGWMGLLISYWLNFTDAQIDALSSKEINYEKE